ncbi:MAG: MerR family transcriptional regulator [Acidobacteriota bacterium]
MGRSRARGKSVRHGKAGGATDRGPELWTIGAVSRATGFSPDILRVWNRRYGFPVPTRKPSGHRLYTPGDVSRLRRISQAISRGHRPARVVALDPGSLDRLLAEEAGAASRERAADRPIAPLLEHVRLHRGAQLTEALLADADALGPIGFVARRMVPLTEAVGDAWAEGSLSIHHEHFYSECAEDVLRSLRLPFEKRARGPSILLATLAGETHRLGLQMAALVTASVGSKPHVLGSDTPVEEIADAWVVRNASAIGISVSISTGGASVHRELARLRMAVPSHVPVFVGGRGARRSHPPAGIGVVEDFERFSTWLRGLRSVRTG